MGKLSEPRLCNLCDYSTWDSSSYSRHVRSHAQRARRVTVGAIDNHKQKKGVKHTRVSEPLTPPGSMLSPLTSSALSAVPVPLSPPRQHQQNHQYRQLQQELPQQQVPLQRPQAQSAAAHQPLSTANTGLCILTNGASRFSNEDSEIMGPPLVERGPWFSSSSQTVLEQNTSLPRNLRPGAAEASLLQCLPPMPYFANSSMVPQPASFSNEPTQPLTSAPQGGAPSDSMTELAELKMLVHDLELTVARQNIRLSRISAIEAELELIATHMRVSHLP